MIALTLAALVGYAVLNGLTGVRLLLVARRTREIPEISLGISYLFGGMLGWALLLGGGALIVQRPEWLHLGHAMEYTGLFFLSLGTLAAALFSWRVFSPNQAWLRALFFLLVAILVADYVENVILTGALFPPTTQFWYWPGALGRSACFVWMAGAALRYHQLLRKRLPLGLADPIVANRVLLWGLAGLMGSLAAILACVCSVLDVWTKHGPAAFLATISFGFVGAAFGWLAFVPPRGYLSWVAKRAPHVAD